MASSRLAIASSQAVVNSLQIEDGGAAPATTTGNAGANATVTPTGTGIAGTRSAGGSSPAKTGTATIAAFTGGVVGREGSVAALRLFGVVVAGGLLM